MDALMRLLGEPFYRCHVSWIINLDKVVSVKNNAVHMIDGKVILLGRNKFQAVRKIYIKYLLDHCEQKNDFK
jgi:DNA-binding LytR/AlgR family response regulator